MFKLRSIRWKKDLKGITIRMNGRKGSVDYIPDNDPSQAISINVLNL